MGSPSGSLGSSGAVHGGPLEALKNVLLVGLRPLQFFGVCQQATRPFRCLYDQRHIYVCRSADGELVLVEYWLSSGQWGYVREVWAPPKLLAKAKSTENERRHEAQVRDLTRPGPKARRI